jgi:hypothetical protein
MNASRANDTDSLVYEDLQYVKKRINLLIYRLNQMEENQALNLDSILSLSDQSLQGVKSLGENVHEEHVLTRDSLRQKTNRLQEKVNDTKDHFARTSMIHFIIHGLAILLIIFLILYIRHERKKSLDYIISRTQSLSGQNEEILQKAGELEEIRKNLEKTRKQQKKLKKRIKKK